MTIELTAVGGYNEVGRQCTAIKIDDEVFIIDLGLHLDHYIKYTEDDEEDINTTNARGLRQAGAVPDWRSIKDWKKQVKAIILTHAHLDHIGAVPYLAHMFECPIYGSPFTIELLKELIADKEITIPNPLIKVEKQADITSKVSADFIHMTHSTVDCKLIALHSTHGVVVIDNDYKIDLMPTFGEPPDFERLKALSGKVVAHVSECLYAPHTSSTPSEIVARQMLEQVLLTQDFKNRAIFVSTFSSHIARLMTIMDMGRALNRKVIFLGRSMAKYLKAATNANIIDLPDHVQIIKYGSQIKNFFKKHHDLSKYLVVCTGHMGEQKATLSKLIDGKLLYHFKPADVVILSSRAIPVPSIIAHRQELERKLRLRKVRLFTDVHVSGHASREDIRALITIINSKHLIPNHGDPVMTQAFVELAREVGYLPERIHSLREGDRIKLL